MIVAVDSGSPDMPAMRIIPVARLLPGDELRGHYERYRKAWTVYPWPITVTRVSDAQDDYLSIRGDLTGCPGTIPVTKRIYADHDVLITFRTGSMITDDTSAEIEGK